MPRSEDFAGRVNYAAAVISNSRATSRAFDSCFENDDGDEVAVLLVRRAENNPRLAANLWRYLARDSVMLAVERLKDVPTREMAAHAAETRRKAREAFDAMMAEREADYEARRQRGRAAGYTVHQSGPYEWTITRPDRSQLVGKPSRESDAWIWAGDDAAKVAA